MKTRNPLSLVLAVIAAVMVLITIILGILCLSGFLRSSEPEPTLPPKNPPCRHRSQTPTTIWISSMTAGS